jgi:membrane protein
MPDIQKLGTGPLDAPTTVPPPPVQRGLRFYVRGSWEFFKKMWPALFDLTTTETYVNASAIAFNIMLSLFSFVVLVGTLLIKVLEWQRGYEAFYYLLRALVPKESGMLFRSLDAATMAPGNKVTLFSFGLLIFSASGVFQPLEAALNRAWGFKERKVIKQYLMYLFLVIICAVIILIPVALGGLYNSAIVAVFGETPSRMSFFSVLGPVLALPFIALLLFVIYYLVPNGKIQASQVVFTSIATAMLWLVGTVIFWLALPLFDFQTSYQELASLMALVTWVFISSFILILGANLSARQVLPPAWTGRLPFLPRRRTAATPAPQA